MQRVRRKLWGLVGLMLALSLMLAVLGQAPEPGYRLRPAPAFTPDRTIQVGMRINNIYDLSLKDKTFTADGWYWLKWPESVQQVISRDRIPIANLVEFTNQVSRWDSLVELEGEQPTREPDGMYLQLYRFSSRFFDDQQSLAMFPFQKLELPITLELRPPQFSMAEAGILLQSTIAKPEILGDSAYLNGYTLQGVTVNQAIRIGTDRGQGKLAAADYSLASYVVGYSSNGLSAFYTHIIPWLAVMMILLLAPNLEADQSDLRIAIPSSALLTLVFLMEGAHNVFPPLGYLTYLDKLYILGYTASALQFWLFVWSNNLYCRSSEDQRPRVKQLVNDADRFYQVSVMAAIAVMLTYGLVRA
jgi:hypothetical protein